MNSFRRVLLLLLPLAALVTPSVSYGQGVIEAIAKSHIEANIPDKSDFGNLLIRDLESYFGVPRKKTVRADYELLREAPTQTGIAYPKYYAWVKIFDGDKLVDEGAVRVAAIERKRFEITHYLSKSDIKHRPPAVDRIFPKALVDIIKKKAGS